MPTITPRTTAAHPTPRSTSPRGIAPSGTDRLTITDLDGAAAFGTVLGVWAHPDDEAYLSAGLMALAAGAGNRVTCVTATRGEHGTGDPERWPPHRLARTRELEITASMAILGVHDHRFLEFEDGTLVDQDPTHGVAIVEQLIEEVAPDTIVTFGPDGMTGHPDHRTVSSWVTRAWQRAGRPGALLYATTTADFADEFADLHHDIAVFGDDLPLRTAASDVAVTVSLGGDLLDRKLAALRAQATQTAALMDMVGQDRFRCWWRNETFRHCAVDPACGHGPALGSGVAREE